MSTDLAAVGPVDVVPATGIPDRLAELVNGWLVAHAGGSADTLRSYRSSIRLWLDYCVERGIDPLDAGKTDVDVWHRVLAQIPSQRTGRKQAPATLAARVSAVASFYRYLVDEEIRDAVPVRRRTRPRAPKDSQTVGLAAAEAAAFHARLDLQVTQAHRMAQVDPVAGAAAVDQAILERAVLLTLLMQGLRIGELLTLTTGALRYHDGEPTMVVHGKGGKVRRIAVAAPAQAALGELRALRFADDPPPDTTLFPLPAGDRGRLLVTRMLRRVARAAGVLSHADLSPHSLRHTCATLMLDKGVHPNVVRDFLGHSSTDTTARYDRARGAVARSAAAVRALTDLLAEQVRI